MAKSTGKLLKCIYSQLGFTKGLSYEIYLDRYGHYYVYDDNHNDRHSPFNVENNINKSALDMFEIIDVDTTTEYIINDVTSGLAKQIETNIKDIIDTNFNGDMSNLKITETVKPIILEKKGDDVANITVTTELKITRENPTQEVSLEEKRYNIIKKLYDRGDIVVVSCWDTDGGFKKLQMLTGLRNLNHDYPYVVVGNCWKYACAVDRKGDEITEV